MIKWKCRGRKLAKVFKRKREGSWQAILHTLTLHLWSSSSGNGGSWWRWGYSFTKLSMSLEPSMLSTLMTIRCILSRYTGAVLERVLWQRRWESETRGKDREWNDISLMILWNTNLANSWRDDATFLTRCSSRFCISWTNKDHEKETKEGNKIGPRDYTLYM